jgi:hypothetical protein
MNTLRRQEKPQDRIECDVYFAANAKVVDDLCIVREILHAAQLDFACA